ncbi:MAG: hypothetical protein GX319_01710 [Clostridiales bacterium]|nr:hypothetical protein [Clostridiales bacterium]
MITVHNAVMEDLTKINLSLAEKTRVVLDLNKSEHISGVVCPQRRSNYKKSNTS